MTKQQKIEPAIKFPAAAQFFGAYFHQDWRENASDPDEVVRDFSNIASVETRLQTKREIEALLAEYTSEDALEVVLDSFGNSYDARRAEGSYTEWLRRILRLIQFGLPSRGKRR